MARQLVSTGMSPARTRQSRTTQTYTMTYIWIVEFDAHFLTWFNAQAWCSSPDIMRHALLKLPRDQSTSEPYRIQIQFFGSVRMYVWKQ